MLSTIFNSEYLGNYINYPSYLNHVVSELQPNPLAFEIYPYLQHGCGVSLNADIYFRIITDFARQSSYSGIPFWGFCNVEAMTSALSIYPIPTEELIRMVVISSFALGAQGIIYKSLCQSTNTSSNTYTLAPIDRDNNRTALWRYIKEINEEMLALNNIFYGSKLLDFTLVKGENSDLSNDIQSPNNLLPIDNIKSGANGVLVTYLLTRGDRYLLFVNTDFQRYNTIEFEQMSGSLTPIKSSTKYDMAFKPMSLMTLVPSGYAIFKWTE